MTHVLIRPELLYAWHGEVLHKRGTLHLVKQPPLESLRAAVKDRFGALVDSVLHH